MIFLAQKTMGPGQSKKYAVLAGCRKTAGSSVELGKWRGDPADLAGAGGGWQQWLQPQNLWLRRLQKPQVTSGRRNFLYNAQLAKWSEYRVPVSSSFSPDWESQRLWVSYWVTGRGSWCDPKAFHRTSTLKSGSQTVQGRKWGETKSWANCRAARQRESSPKHLFNAGGKSRREANLCRI